MKLNVKLLLIKMEVAYETVENLSKKLGIQYDRFLEYIAGIEIPTMEEFTKLNECFKADFILYEELIYSNTRLSADGYSYTVKEWRKKR